MLLLELLLYLLHIIFEYFGLLRRHLYLLGQNILFLDHGGDLIVLLQQVVADLVPLVLADHALRADICLAIFAEVLSLLLWVF